MKGATSDDIVIPEAEGKVRIQADVPVGYIDVLCKYSPRFTGSLLSDNYVLRGDVQKKFYKSQVMSKYFALDDEKFSQDLKTRQSVDLEDPKRYNTEYGSCN